MFGRLWRAIKREPLRGNEADVLHHLTVGGGFLVQFHGVGAGGGGHAPETHQAASEGELVVRAHLGDGDAIILRQDRKTLLAGADDIVAAGYLGEQQRDVGLLDNLEVFV